MELLIALTLVSLILVQLFGGLRLASRAWDSIEEHDALEKKTLDLAEQLKKEAWTPVHKLLLEYLLRSETLHDSLLEQLSEFKSDMTRTSGA